MGKDQHTSGTVESVTEGQSDLLVLATKNYPGGKEKLELAKGHTNFQSRLWELLDVLAGERVLQLPILEKPIWKTIRLGVHKNADEYRKAIKTVGGKISDWANDILGKPAFTVADQPMDIDLVVVTVAELGFPKGAIRADIYKRAAEFGLEPCPAEAGPALREQYMDQPNDEWLRIAMKPIVGSNGDPRIFSVGPRCRRPVVALPLCLPRPRLACRLPVGLRPPQVVPLEPRSFCPFGPFELDSYPRSQERGLFVSAKIDMELGK